ncbi:hypothetical protein [Hymenobacter latericoloratus]|uniref:DUF998 domain-containing protein n=1 Tax=Hymenobacter latericoloratus TaxID=1411121 RepID=A0ABR6JWX1_9BACT|nr:hypothetical protein [Hymenobacter latericoloratus]MBB4601313.1 hypothetical protein [Hymenobacter latericoloratus]
MSISIPVVFVFVFVIFFTSNRAVFNELGVLNLFQYNIHGINYRFMPVLFGYILLGGAIIVLWQQVRTVAPKIKLTSWVFTLSGLLLFALGVIPVNQNSFLAEWVSLVFVFINVLGLLFLLSKTDAFINKIFILCLMVSILYEVSERFIFLHGDIFDFNKSLVMCFLQYLLLYKYLCSEFRLTKANLL